MQNVARISADFTEEKVPAGSFEHPPYRVQASSIGEEGCIALGGAPGSLDDNRRAEGPLPG